MSNFGNLIHELFSEPGPNGTVSWGRVASAIALVGAMVWITHIVLTLHSLPGFDGVTAFVLAPYAANKTAATVQAFSQNPVPGK
jgi:hypothetical protein